MWKCVLCSASETPLPHVRLLGIVPQGTETRYIFLLFFTLDNFSSVLKFTASPAVSNMNFSFQIFNSRIFIFNGFYLSPEIADLFIHYDHIFL